MVNETFGSYVGCASGDIVGILFEIKSLNKGVFIEVNPWSTQ